MPAIDGRIAGLLVAALVSLLSASVRAETLDQDLLDKTEPLKPKWEAGVAGVALRVADYPAADEYRNLVLPAPYVVYRGRTLKSDEEGSRLRRKLRPNVELSISGAGALSSNSGDSKAREGMPDLGYLLEVGPNLRLSYPGWAPGSKILVDIPMRGVVSLDHGDFNWRGGVFAPELGYQSQALLGERLRLRASIGVEIASTALQRYYYEVRPLDARPDRPAYAASAGYLGTELGLLAYYDLSPRLRLFVALNYNNHAGAANENSPLFRSQDDYGAVTGLSWSLFQSSRQVAD